MMSQPRPASRMGPRSIPDDTDFNHGNSMGTGARSSGHVESSYWNSGDHAGSVSPPQASSYFAQTQHFPWYSSPSSLPSTLPSLSCGYEDPLRSSLSTAVSDMHHATIDDDPLLSASEPLEWKSISPGEDYSADQDERGANPTFACVDHATEAPPLGPFIDNIQQNSGFYPMSNAQAAACACMTSIMQVVPPSLRLVDTRRASSYNSCASSPPLTSSVTRNSSLEGIQDPCPDPPSSTFFPSEPRCVSPGPMDTLSPHTPHQSMSVIPEVEAILDPFQPFQFRLGPRYLSPTQECDGLRYKVPYSFSLPHKLYPSPGTFIPAPPIQVDVYATHAYTTYSGPNQHPTIGNGLELAFDIPSRSPGMLNYGTVQDAMAHTDGNITSIPSTLQSLRSVPVVGPGVARSTIALTRQTWPAIGNASGAGGAAAHRSDPEPVPSHGEFKELEQVPYPNGNRKNFSTGGASKFVDYGPTGYRLDKLLQTGYVTANMPNCDERAFPETECGQKPTFRYEYKDYTRYHRQVNVRTMSDGKLVQPSKGRLAFLAAQEMKYYIANHPDFPFALSDLWLRSIDKPSKGTLQPHLWTTKVVTQPGYPRRSGTV